MAYLDTAGTGSLRGLTGSGSAVVSVWDSVPIAPANGTTCPATAESLRVLVSSLDHGGADVHLQVSIDPLFASTIVDQILPGRPDGIFALLASGLASLQTYAWRVRASQPGTSAWTPWSPVWLFTVNASAANAIEYVFANVGATPAFVPYAVEFVGANIGIEDLHDPGAFETALANIGFAIDQHDEAVEYAASNVDESVPFPHIWFIRPRSGRAGDGVEMVGLGFGDLQGASHLEQRASSGAPWTGLGATSWQTFPGTPAALTPERRLDAATGWIDQQHDVAEFTVPTVAAPPGMQVRIVTEEA